MSSLINFVAMQIGWFACVLGAANHMPWTGTAIALALAAWHLMRSADTKHELKLFGIALAAGFIIDSSLAASGVLQFASGTIVSSLTTPWMLALWLGFASALTGSLAWLVARPMLATAFGAVGGPLAYLSGEKLGAISLHGDTVLFAIGAAWAAAMLAFSWFARRPRPTPAAEKEVQEAASA